MARKASQELETFIDEAIRRCAAAGYHPTVFQRMRRQHGTLEAMVKLLPSGEVQTGFKKLKSLGMLDCSIEAATLKFAGEFTPSEVECAKFRLTQYGNVEVTEPFRPHASYKKRLP
jgi:hypothetical protein